jgi:hypothetical protein
MAESLPDSEARSYEVKRSLSLEAFCDAHAEDEEWHPGMLRGGDEGGGLD